MEPRLVVNGQTRELGEVGGHVTLLEWLRGSGLHRAARKAAPRASAAPAPCWWPGRRRADRTRWTAINACLVPAAGVRRPGGRHRRGLGQPGALHPVQREMADRGGSQCGYCTPGFICSMAAEFYRPDRRPSVTGAPGQVRTGRIRARSTAIARPARREADEHGPNGFDLHALSGNLCRCTGYRPIRDAAYALGEPEPDDPILARMDRPAPAAGRRPRSTAARATSSGRPTWPRPSSCWPRTRTPGWWPAPPTGASSSTSGTPGPR